MSFRSLDIELPGVVHVAELETEGASSKAIIYNPFVLRSISRSYRLLKASAIAFGSMAR